MTMMRLYGHASPLGQEAAPVLVGLGLVALAGIALWYRDDLYWALQWVMRYPQRGLVYFAAQIAIPVAGIMVGVALILYPVTGW